MRKLLVTLGVLLGVASGSAWADEMTADDLFQMCNSSDRITNRLCTRYILGVAQGLGMSQSLKTGQRICIPDNLAEGRFANVFQATATQLSTYYPQDLKLPAISIVTASLLKAFPCR